MQSEMDASTIPPLQTLSSEQAKRKRQVRAPKSDRHTRSRDCHTAVRSTLVSCARAPGSLPMCSIVASPAIMSTGKPSRGLAQEGASSGSSDHLEASSRGWLHCLLNGSKSPRRNATRSGLAAALRSQAQSSTAPPPYKRCVRARGGIPECSLWCLKPPQCCSRKTRASLRHPRR